MSECVILPLSVCVHKCVSVHRVYSALKTLAAGVVSHVRRKMKGMIPVNNEQACLYLEANNQQVKSQPPSPLYYDPLTFFPFSSSSLSSTPCLAINYSLSHFPCFPQSALSLSISLTLIYLPGCIFSDVTPAPPDSVVHSSAHGLLSVSLPVSITLPLCLSVSLSQLLGSDRTNTHNELAFSFASLFSLRQPSLESSESL